MKIRTRILPLLAFLAALASRGKEEAAGILVAQQGLRGACRRGDRAAYRYAEAFRRGHFPVLDLVRPCRRHRERFGPCQGRGHRGCPDYSRQDCGSCAGCERTGRFTLCGARGRRLSGPQGCPRPSDEFQSHPSPVTGGPSRLRKKLHCRCARAGTSPMQSTEGQHIRGTPASGLTPV